MSGLNLFEYLNILFFSLSLSLAVKFCVRNLTHKDYTWFSLCCSFSKVQLHLESELTILSRRKRKKKYLNLMLKLQSPLLKNYSSFMVSAAGSTSQWASHSTVYRISCPCFIKLAQKYIFCLTLKARWSMLMIGFSSLSWTVSQPWLTL